ncbi:hypothetical protein DKX38_014706 [Salix brachista]|uniref:Uncharacterized protein n=1 Tax=Salix brachista TaxID=2182728 RepID=A0A5N5LGG2_9ROSI|nr:hypothetical protein DKX38_014706 [Salix brachista]
MGRRGKAKQNYKHNFRHPKEVVLVFNGFNSSVQKAMFCRARSLEPQKFGKKKETADTEAKTALANNKKRSKRQPKEKEWRFTLPGFQVPESPCTRLKREGLTALHLVVLVPGIVIGGLELWEGKP